MEKRYQVFVSSTFRDLIDERRHVMHALLEIDCIPAGMELFPAADQGAWQIIERVIDLSDYYVLIVGGRYGSMAEDGISFTEREYDYAVSTGKYVLPFLHESPDEIPIGKSDVNSDARLKLAAFRKKVESKHTFKSWRNADDLGGKLSRALTQAIKMQPAAGWVRADKGEIVVHNAADRVAPPEPLQQIGNGSKDVLIPVNKLAGIQYVGEEGTSRDCKDAVMRLVQYGDLIDKVRILSSSGSHCMLIALEPHGLVAVKSGFSSGYSGEGPSALSYVLRLLEEHGAEIEEYNVASDVLDRLDRSALTQEDIAALDKLRPIRPMRWHNYILEGDENGEDTRTPWFDFPPVIPFAVIDARIKDIVIAFWDGPDEKLLIGYRRLEDAVRRRTGLSENGQRLFSQAFHGSGSKLLWKGMSEAEQAGRALLFAGAYGAYRNPRVHRESAHNNADYLAELLLLNHLFLLEGESVARGS